MQTSLHKTLFLVHFRSRQKNAGCIFCQDQGTKANRRIRGVFDHPGRAHAGDRHADWPPSGHGNPA
ncbi:hypothetical protein [Rhodospira trueperi]|uniref:hypothetical protein n=1 Tax=Rhodospira trueperi TaxID=69960 RepID=UPI00115F9924|nr:hypothetical protein [Rhodospira trueperi]